MFRALFYMTLGLLALPFLLLRFGPQFFFNLFRDPFSGITSELAERHVLLESTRSKVDTGEGLVEEIRALVRTEDWPALSARLQEAVATKRDSAPLEREYSKITWAARLDLNEILDKLHPEQCTAKLAELVKAYDKAADAHPGDAGLAAIAARAHLDVGWAWRGDGYAGEVTRQGWEELQRHYQLAAERIAPFMDGEKLHPSIAHAAHILARQNGDDGREMRNLYDAWRSADPGNPQIYAEHGFHLLPRWFGDYDELAREAHRAGVAETDRLGAAPYFWLYAHVLECEELALTAADPEMFIEGVADHVRLAGTSHEANRVLRMLCEVWTAQAMDQRLQAAEAPVRDMARAAARAIVENRLFDIDASAWDGRCDDARRTIALLYKDEIDEGYVLDFTSGNFELRAEAA